MAMPLKQLIASARYHCFPDGKKPMTTRDTRSSANSETLQRQDNQFLHPWENMYELGTNKRTIITQAEGIYVVDSEGNRLIDGPAGM